jgi:two-component system, NtrC family, sensor kinase
VTGPSEPVRPVASYRQPLGLRVQILVGLGVVTGFAMLSTGYLALWASGQSVISQREGTARAVAAGLAGAAGAVVDPALPLGNPTNRARLVNTLRGIESHSDLAAFEVIGADRRVVLARPPRAGAEIDPPIVAAVLAGVGPALHYRTRDDGSTELSAYAPIPADNRVLGAVRVALEAPEPLATVLGRSSWLLVLLAAIDGLLVVGLGYFVLTRLVVQPLQAMQVATSRVGAGDWELKIKPSGPSEVAALAGALNQMTESLVRQREQLIRTEKLASVGQLAAGVAHEIGNPLAAVLGYVDILRADSAGDGPPLMTGPERRDALERVKAETQRINKIIQDLLAYSRPTKEEAEVTDPRKVLQSAQALLSPQARFRGVKIRVEDPGSTVGESVTGRTGGDRSWPRVLASAGRLNQVFLNLLLNAADAMDGQGVVTVACERSMDKVKIRFKDEGPGIHGEVARKIFDPFFTTKAPGQGTGLGLSISRSIIEAWHGQLELIPTPPGERGAMFLITLPAARTTEAY